MLNIMIDLETLDTRPTAIVVSIGAVAFSKEGVIKTFYTTLNMEDQVQKHRTIGRASLMWWLGQSKETIANTFVPENSPDLSFDVVAIHNFLNFYDEIKDLNGGEKPCVWGNGVDFDIAIMADLLPSYGFRTPWGIRSRCFRLLKNKDPDLYMAVRKTPFEGLKHNALSDALHQVKILLSVDHIKDTL